MNKFKVRTYDVGAFGFFTQADAYNDYDFESAESLELFAARLGKAGFRAGNRWVMGSAIVWIEQKGPANG